MFLCSGAGAAQPPSEGVLRGTRKNKAIGAVFRYGTCASGPREHACGSRQLRKFSTSAQIVHGNAVGNKPHEWDAQSVDLKARQEKWRPFSPSREHPLLLALGQQSETRLRACGLPTYFCLLRMLKPRTSSPTVVGLMWAGCRGIHSSRLWRQRVTSGEGRTTTPFRVD
jgi:hypothetical protein